MGGKIRWETNQKVTSSLPRIGPGRFRPLSQTATVSATTSTMSSA